MYQHELHKFCKCQQEKVTLSRYVRTTKTVEGKRVQLPGDRKIPADWLLRWTSIPSDVPSPSPGFMQLGEWCL